MSREATMRGPFTFDPFTRTITHKGIKIELDMFESFAHEANVGRLFRFVKLEDGVISIFFEPQGSSIEPQQTSS